MKLLRLCAHEIKVGHPLPWGVRNEPGHLLRNHANNPSFAQDITEVGGQIQLAIGKDVDVGKFEMVHNESTNYAITHSLQTAFVAYLVAERLGGSASERVSVVSAALSMNIAMIELQNSLVSQVTPLTPEQRQSIHGHSSRGREVLEQLGVTDREWLRAVEQHHVTDGGGPLPEQRAHISDVACLVHYVDVYLAKLSSRATRPALATLTAAQQLFLSAGGATNPYTAAIVKEMGVYPPGTFVKLASGETGVVVRSGESAHTPRVCALISADGRVYVEAIARDTARETHKIVSTVPRSNVLIRLNRHELLGYPQR
jgi:HD-GYP domain-containing protein (c-di-GMP phosphodiesterase class II)